MSSYQNTAAVPVMAQEEPIKPLPAWRAAIYFIVAGVVLRFAFYRAIPMLENAGLAAFEAFMVAAIVPLALLFALAFGIAKETGTPENGRAFAKRFRLRRPTRLQAGWVVLSLAAAVGASALLSPTQEWVLRWAPFLQPPEGFPAVMDPTLQSTGFSQALAGWMGPQAGGNGGWILLIFIFFFFNIMGEELLWRGLLLPRQELAHGRAAWIVNGLLWHLFHLIIFPWYLISGLPLALLIAFVAQKTQNSWSSIIVHGAANLGLVSLMFLTIVSG